MKITVTAPVTKVCPYRDEVDVGTVTITFDIMDGDGPELHGFAAYLAAFTDRALSHEMFTRIVAVDHDAATSSTWTTAGMAVTVDVPRDEH